MSEWLIVALALVPFLSIIFLKEKTSVNGHVWVGRNLVPRLMFYSFFFMGAFGAQIALIALSFMIKGLVIETSFLFLTGMTAVAMVLFFVEGTSLYRKTNPKNRSDNEM